MNLDELLAGLVLKPDNADTKQFESMVMDAVGIETITAVPGLTVEI